MTVNEGTVDKKKITAVIVPAALPPCSAVSLRLTGSRKSSSEATPPKAGLGVVWRKFRTIGKAKPFRTGCGKAALRLYLLSDIERTPDTFAAAIQYVGVDHGRSHILVT